MSEQPEALQIAHSLEAYPDALAKTAAAELRRLHEENERLQDDYLRTCGLVADMHAAATGGHDGPRRGVVEDIQDLRAVNQELLEALKAADWYIGQLEPFVYGADDDDVHEEHAKVRAAIARAEGETK